MRFGNSGVFVADVPATVGFYQRAFGQKLRYMHPSKGYAELETGATLLSFVGEAFIDDAKLIGGQAFHANRTNGLPSGAQFAFITEDIERDYRRALDAGAVAITAPDAKPWGQTMAYVRDNNGFLVELATPPVR